MTARGGSANFATNDLTRLTTGGAVTTLGGFSADAGPRHLARGTGGTLWVSLEKTRRVALRDRGRGAQSRAAENRSAQNEPAENRPAENERQNEADASRWR